MTGGNEKWNQTINPVAVRNGTFAVLLNVATPAEHVTHAAFGCAEKEPSSGFDISCQFRISRFASERAQESDNLARISFGQRDGGHLRAGNALDRVANDVFVRAAVLPLPARQIWPAPAFRRVAVTGRTVLSEQPRAFFDAVVRMLR